MKQYQEIIKRGLLLTAPSLGSSLLAIYPSQAATFATSQGALEFTNFSQIPVNIGTETDTNTVAIAKDGRVQAIAQAYALFTTTPPEAFNLSFSGASGDGKDYLGLAESKAQVIGEFSVDTNQTLSFDFLANLEMETSIDNSPVENATARGDISFFLIDAASDRILDFFSLSGNLITEGNDDFVVFDTSDNVSLTQVSQELDFEGTEETAGIFVEGSFQRTFTNNTKVTLVEVKSNQTRVKAPEPSAILALVLSSGIMSIAAKLKRQLATAKPEDNALSKPC
ncbi:hypothetical protein NUACC21_37490 [Scytonema sp. NUACC21]